MNVKTIMQDFHDSFHSKAQAPDMIELWMRIAEEYSKRSLTYETDKLIALNGLAKHFQINSLQDYTAGNWMANIRDMLLWYTSNNDMECQRPTEYIAPSWSWASSPYDIGFIILKVPKSSLNEKKAK
jgi:hypothetical protein